MLTLFKVCGFLGIRRNLIDLFERYKARVVGGGAGQKTGIDYGETISPIVKLATI